MKVFDALLHLKTKKKLADLLCISKSAVSQWGEDIPMDKQYELEVKTGGLIKSDYTVNKEKSNGNN